MLIEHVASAPREEPQLLVCQKLELAVILAMFSFSEPVFVSSTGCAELVVPTTALPNLTLVTERIAFGNPPQAHSRHRQSTAERYFFRCTLRSPRNKNESPGGTTMSGKVGDYELNGENLTAKTAHMHKVKVIVENRRSHQLAPFVCQNPCQ